MTLVHLAVSARRNAANSSGVLGDTVPPSARSSFWTSGMARTLITSWLRRSTTARGVPALRLGETAESCSPGAGTPTDAADHVHGPAVEVQGLFSLPLAEAREAHEGTLPHYFG